MSMHKRNKQLDQNGIVSFMVTLIMMMVITLIVVGFTQVTNRARREATDRQLSVQAMYAAESGVNAVYNALSSDPASIKSQTKCDETNYVKPVLSAGAVEVTCLLVDPTVENIKVDPSRDASKVVFINPTDSNGTNASISSLTIEWTPPLPTTPDWSGCAASTSEVGVFKTNGDGCDYAFLRIDLMQYQDPNVGSPQAETLNSKTISLYIQPSKVLSSTTISSTNKSVILGALCNDTSCVARIGLDSTLQGKMFYARISTMYNDTQSVTIDGTKTSSNDAFFTGGQVKIDSTARAQDVLRRVQARVSLSGLDADSPIGAILSGETLCKRFEIGGTLPDPMDKCSEY